jgi:glycerate 2-kinase
LKLKERKLKRDAFWILRKALEAADAGNAVRRYLAPGKGMGAAGGDAFRLEPENYDRIFLIAAGKAAVPMAQAVEEIVGVPLAREMVITKHGHTGPLRDSVAIEAGHPIPDEAGEKAAREIRNLVSGKLRSRDLLLVAISGGASAILPAPVESVTLKAKQETTDLLLRAGANIHELNAVRKHLSFLKGGRLAKLAYPATVVSLLLSDVIGDPLDVIGSGPTAPDGSTFGDAIAVLERYDLLERVPRAVSRYLDAGARGEIEETPKPGDPVFDKVHNLVVGSNRLALEAAQREALSLGYETQILSSTVEGEARKVGMEHAKSLRAVLKDGRPRCFLAGGETTVTVRGAGKGGRNQELALAAAIGIEGLENVAVLSAGTDGTDGPTDAAGAFATGSTLLGAAKLGLDAREHLAHNDSYPFFESLGDLIKTGPTGTNVMDIQILLAG